MRLSDEIKRAEKQMLTGERVLAIMGLLQEHKNGLECDYHFGGDYLRIEINRLAALTKTRKMLRDLFGEWSDKLSQRFVCENTLYTIWKPKNFSEYPIEIWYGCPVDNIDEKLKEPGCGIIERTIIEKDYVCDLSEATNER